MRGCNLQSHLTCLGHTGQEKVHEDSTVLVWAREGKNIKWHFVGGAKGELSVHISLGLFGLVLFFFILYSEKLLGSS